MPDATRQEVRCWLDQAEEDLRVARETLDHIEAPSHGRYWYQQCYEKTIKAWGLMAFSSPDDNAEALFRRFFLQRHAPIRELANQGPSMTPHLKRFMRQVESFIESSGHASALRQLDATLPTTDPTQISFRYPFRDIEDGGRWMAPVEYAGWDRYQGNQMAVEAAVGRLMKLVEEEWSDFQRAGR